jgi:hypothetical protein
VNAASGCTVSGLVDDDEDNEDDAYNADGADRK